MRRHSLILLAAATIGLAASQASAADLPRKAPAYMPPPPPVATWTGCYFGGNIGGAFGDASLSGPGGTVSTDGSGFAGGGQIGCDYQFSGGWVVGIRNMFDGTSNKRSGTIAGGPLAGDRRQLQQSMVRHVDRPPRVCVSTRVVAVPPGRRCLGSYKHEHHFRWRSNRPDLQHRIRLDDWWRR